MSIHHVYADMTDDDKAIVDDAFTAAIEAIASEGHTVAFDDRAERLVEAIAVFMRDSKR